MPFPAVRMPMTIHMSFYLQLPRRRLLPSVYPAVNPPPAEAMVRNSPIRLASSYRILLQREEAMSQK